MSNHSELSPKQLKDFEKGFLYLDIATQFLHLVYDDLRRDDPLLRDQQRRSELMDCIALNGTSYFQSLQGDKPFHLKHKDIKAMYVVVAIQCARGVCHEF